MLNNKDYCDYETRNELIKLGYPAHLYDNTEVDKILGAILLYEAQKWLREEKDIIVYPMSIGDLQHQKWYAKIEYMDFYCYPVHDTYEEALSEGIKEAVKILKEKLNEET